MGFVCSFCGETHDEDLLDIRARFPDPVFELSETDRAERVHDAADACILDPGSAAPRYFIRGTLEMPIDEIDDTFAYGVWLEVSEPSYHRIGALWSDPAGKEEPPFRGFLANELHPYHGTFGLAAELQLRDVEKVPSIRLVRGSHPLERDQSAGITLARAHELASYAD